MKGVHFDSVEIAKKKNAGIQRAEIQLLLENNPYEVSISEQDEDIQISDATLDISKNKSKN